MLIFVNNYRVHTCLIRGRKHLFEKQVYTGWGVGGGGWGGVVDFIHNSEIKM